MSAIKQEIKEEFSEEHCMLPLLRDIKSEPDNSQDLADKFAYLEHRPFKHVQISPQMQDWVEQFKCWSYAERRTAIDQLFSSAIFDVTQLRFMMTVIEPHLQRDFITSLPKELSLYILSFLEPIDLIISGQACHYWRTITDDILLWKDKCRDEGLLTDGTDFLQEFYQNRLVTVESESPECVNCSDYKWAYFEFKSFEHNWRYGQFDYEEAEVGSRVGQPADNPAGPTEDKRDFLCQARPMRSILQLKGHEDHVITCLQLNNSLNIIISGSDDNTIRVWCARTGACLRTLMGHTGGVWATQLSPEGIIVSGSTDRTLRVWNALTGECSRVLYGHTSTVRCLALNGARVVSGSRDQMLRIWDIKEGMNLQTLVGHRAAVRCVQFHGNLVVSGAYDSLVKVWDAQTGACLHTLEGHTNRVYSLQFDGVHIVSGSMDTTIRVWNPQTGELKHTLTGHQSLTSGMMLRGDVLVSGNADATVKIWDLNTGECIRTLAGANQHTSAVTSLQFNSKFVITSSDDGTVKLWDFTTGAFIRNLVHLPTGGSGGVVWRVRSSPTKLVCAVGSRNEAEETKILVLDFEFRKNDFKRREPVNTLSLVPAQTPVQYNDVSLAQDKEVWGSAFWSRFNDEFSKTETAEQQKVWNEKRDLFNDYLECGATFECLADSMGWDLFPTTPALPPYWTAADLKMEPLMEYDTNNNNDDDDNVTSDRTDRDDRSNDNNQAPVKKLRLDIKAEIKSEGEEGDEKEELMSRLIDGIESN